MNALISGLSFSAPFALIALAMLPAIWILLRATPPRPQKWPFPPLKILLGLEKTRQTPVRTPWPLLLLRLIIAALAILACAGPFWTPPDALKLAGGPLLVLADDGWSAAPDWDRRRAQAQSLIAAAERTSMTAAFASLSEISRGGAVREGGRTSEILRASAPKPYLIERAPALVPVKAFLAAHPQAQILWIADGLENGGARAFADALSALAPGRFAVVAPSNGVRALKNPVNETAAMAVDVVRQTLKVAQKGRISAFDARGALVGAADFDFGSERATQARFEAPTELRNAIQTLRIDGEESAGATALLDDQSRRRRVGLVSGALLDVSQPLLAPNYYLARALNPFADVIEAKPNALDPIGELIEDGVGVLVLSDIAIAAGETQEKLEKFMTGGGVVIRFAGSRLAGSNDELTPTTLRRGDRRLGGALSWERPKKLGAFEEDSPFRGLSVGEDVTVQRQLLAEPEPGLTERTWAQLADKTPVVTADKRGKGLLVLFHVTADTSWSNLPLSGLFPEMLKKIVVMAGAGRTQDGAPAQFNKAPWKTLDGFGRLGAPSAQTRALDASVAARSGPDYPPGLYGVQDALTALNTLAPEDEIVNADFGAAPIMDLQTNAPIDLRGPAFEAALALFLLDMIVALWLTGLFGRSRGRNFAKFFALMATVAFIGSLSPAFDVRAKESSVGEKFAGGEKFAEKSAPAAPQSAARAGPPKRDIEAALTTRLAFIVTGDGRTDEASRQGLRELSRILSQRTSLSPGDPVGLDPARDELAFYPLIYWPIVASAPQPPQLAKQKIAAYMKNGGFIVFDTRDALSSRPGAPTPEQLWLRQLMEGVETAELEIVPRDHVVTKTFYLLDRIVGRHASGDTWIEALPPAPPGADRPARASDSVSPMIVTANDLAGAWAADERGAPLYPYGEGGPRQRELALRAGVNLVMYTLTGNYKADQVHVRDLLQRLGH